MADKVIFAEQTVEGFEADANLGGVYSSAPLFIDGALAVGEEYTVVWDGNEYTCTAQDMSVLEAGAVVVGNVSGFGGTGNGEPFAVMSNNASGTQYFVFYAMDSSTTHTVAIYEAVAEDKQYLIYESTLTGIADAIRSKTESTEPIAVTEMATQIADITIGGGSVEGVHFVTFMSEDGTTELYKRPVADGDDCADPVARGLIEAPTKESTAQYNYTFVGWATTPGGAWNENSLKAVTEDKVVYATYASVLRYYTITYFDDDGSTVLNTERLAYGSTPTYTPEKSGGYKFTGWTPDISVVTCDASYQAQWRVVVEFAETDWARIAEMSADGSAKTAWEIGDTKTLTFTTSGGKTETVTLAIIGFDHDDLADGSGKAGITLGAVDVSAVVLNQHGTLNGWPDSVSRNYLNGDYLNAMPSDLQAVIKSVTKVSSGSMNSGLATTEDKIWLFSVEEVLDTADIPAGNYNVGQGYKYEYFNATTRRASDAWITRSMSGTSTYYGFYSDGTLWANCSYGRAEPPRFGFCI